jgi:hypothetical protein
MTNNLLRIKFQQRLNKLASFDYDNLECWQIVEAFNKAQREWYHRQVHGLNLKKETGEQSINTIDDLQKFVTIVELSGVSENDYFESTEIPRNYLGFIRVNALANLEKCTDRNMTVYLAEEANAKILLDDVFKGPDFDWGETFCTLVGNKIRVYTNNKFNISQATLVYYRSPLDISFDNCINPSTGQSSSDQECEFRDTVIEFIIDGAVAIIAGDIESFNQYQRAMQTESKSN